MGFREPTTEEETELGTVVEERVGKLMKGETTGKMMKAVGERMVECIWRLCKMDFESGVEPED